MSPSDREKVASLLHYRNSILQLLSLSGGPSLLNYRRACEVVLKLVLGRTPTDEELDTLLCQREGE
jgi:hypothetical protein